MELRKLADFKLENVTKINSDKAIIVDECHYIGAFFSTTQASPVSLDGLRYNLIHGLDLNSDTVNAELYRVPTGVVNESIGTNRPKTFRYRDMLVYENRDAEETINLYVGEKLVATIVDVSMTDRLIVLTNDVIDSDTYHAKSRYPHRISKNLLVQSHIQEFNTIMPKDILGADIPEFKGVPSAFSILPPFKRVIVGVYLNTSRCLPSSNNYEYSWEPIYRVYDQPYLPAKSDKLI